jgi:hypothetical protein
MKSYAAFIAAAVLLAGCEEGDGLSAILGPVVPSVPGLSVTGRWAGDLSSSRDPFVLFPSVLQLSQSGNNVTGTLTISTGRTAAFNGTLSGSRITGSFSFTDVCGGNATTTADVIGTTRLNGTYNLNDCSGTSTGGYVLDRGP